MKAGRIVGMLLLLVSMSGLTGCAMFNDEYTLGEVSRQNTIGQELIDLHKAREMGIITEEEYESIRKDIMKGGPYDVEDINLKKAKAMGLITEAQYDSLKN